MGGKNKSSKNSAPQAAQSTESAATERKPSKTLEQMQADYAKDPDGTLRKASHHYARKLTGNDKLTWIEYCDMKIELYKKLWEAKKTNPDARAPKALTPEQLEKKRKALEKANKRAAKLQAAIAAAEAAAQVK